MWDLDSIIRQNNQEAINWMMRGQQVEVAESPQPATWSLSILAEKLKVGPPLLAELINCCTDFETIKAFLGLIRNYLPEHELEILSEKRHQRLYRFCYLWGQKYFPLPAYTHERDLGEFVDSMPVMLMGMSYSAYHELEMRSGYLLLLSLIMYPYEGDDRDLEEDEVRHTPFGDPIPAQEGKTLIEVFGGARIPLLETVQRIVGERAARTIPVDGWNPAELHDLTDKTPYEGVADFAAWACSETGCIVLDSNYENCEYQEGDGGPSFKWSRDNVELLTEQWPKVQEIRARIDHMVEWLEADPANRFEELLKFLLSKKPKQKRKGKAKIHFYDPTDHLCPLDQIFEGEEEDNACEEITRF